MKRLNFLDQQIIEMQHSGCPISRVEEISPTIKTRQNKNLLFWNQAKEMDKI